MEKCVVCGKHSNEVACVVYQTETERKRIYNLIDVFFDDEIQAIYDEKYGQDSDEPMTFDEIKKYLKEWLDNSYSKED